MKERPTDENLAQRTQTPEETQGLFPKQHVSSHLRQEHLEAIIDNTNMSVFLKDADCKYIYINRQFEYLAGITNSEAQGKDDFEIFSEPVARLFRAQDQEVIRSRQLVEFEETILLPDGEHSFITAKFPLLTSERTVDAICGICADITSQKQTEANLREAEEKYRGIFEHSPLGILLINKNGIITKANEKLAQILGSSVDKIIGFDLLQTAEDERVREATLSVLSGQITHYLGHYSSVTGSKSAYIRSVFSPIFSRDKSINAAIGIVENITRQKEAEEALQRAYDELEQRVIARTAELNKQTQRLKETNVALEILLKKRGEDKKNLEKAIMLKVEKLIFPNLEKLKMKQSEASKKALLEIIEFNLADITSSFSHLPKNYLSALTPTQIQIAELIKHGHTTKEIAEILTLSPSTIACHRQAIRKRLSLSNKKVNLQAALLANA